MQIKSYLLILILSFSLASKPVDTSEWLKKNQNEIIKYSKCIALGAVNSYFFNDANVQNSSLSGAIAGVLFSINFFNILSTNSASELQAKGLTTLLGAFICHKIILNKINYLSVAPKY